MGAFTDLVYFDVGDSHSGTRNLSINDVPLPASVTAAADFDLKSTIWTLAAIYRVAAGSEPTFDVLMGARLGHMEQNLDCDLTWQAELGLTYSFGWGDLGVAWRYLDHDLKSDGPIEELNFNGPAVGAIFRW